MFSGQIRALASGGAPLSRRQLAGWVCLGLAGSACLPVFGAGLTRGHVRWWLDPQPSLSGSTSEVLVYLGMIALTVAWLGLGRHARMPALGTRSLWLICLVWGLPLLISAPVFSRDIYSYFAQGTILHLGLNPYHVTPTVLASGGHGPVLAAVDPYWRHNTAPYGPLFLEAVSGLAALVGSHVVLGAQLVKLLELIGLALLAVFVPRLARANGSDPSTATWLALLNPLVMFALLTPGHNDLLMVGLLVAGVTLAVEGHPLAGVLVCALGATVKLPAILGAVFIAFSWARAAPHGAAALRRLTVSGLLAAGAMAVVSLPAGLGVSWVTASLFSTPARVHLAITPTTSVAWTAYRLLGGDFHAIQSALRIAVLVVVLVFTLELLRRVRFPTLARYLGLALVAFAVGGPAAWPWYFTWGFALLAATPWRRWHSWIVGLMIAGGFVIKPDGILALSVGSSPFVLVCYLLLLGTAWYAWRRRKTPPPAVAGADAGQVSEPGRPALIES